jgi:hypothetical protein
MTKSFKAGSAYIELFASKKKLKSDLSKVGREIPRDMQAVGKESAKKYQKGFDGLKAGRGIGDSITKGIKAGSKDIKSLLLGGGAVIAGGAAITGILGGIAKKAFSTAREVQELADSAGVTAEEFQEMAFAFKQFGVEGKETSDILKDMNDRLGDFAQTGGGPVADFFENIAPKVGLTIDSFRELSSDRALGLYVKALEDANLNQQDMSFYMEALASDSTKLLPAFRNGGRVVREFRQEARDMGLVLSNEAVAGAVSADQKLEQLGDTIKTGLTGAIIQSAEEIEELTDSLIALTPKLVGWAQAGLDGLSLIASGIEGIKEVIDTGGIDLGPAFEIPPLKIELAEMQAQKAKLITEIDDALNRKNTFINRTIAKRLEKNLAALEKDITAKKAELAAFGPLGGIPSGPIVPSPRLKPSNGESGKVFDTTVNAKSTSTSSSSGLDKQFLDSLEESKRQIIGAKDAYEASLTPLEAYKAKLAFIAGLNLNPALESFGGQETVVRAKKEALVALASEAGDATAAFGALTAQVAKEELTLEDAADVMARVNEELGLTEDRAALAEAAWRTEKELLQEAIDLQAQEIENELILARLKGDRRDVEELERQLELLRERSRLIFNAKNPSDLKGIDGKTEGIISDRDAAEVEGKLRDAFKSGFRAVIDDNFGDYLENKLKNAASPMFDDAIDTLFDALFGAEGLIGDLGGLFGEDGLDNLFGAASGFAGFFANGGRIPSGKSGVVGEGGGMKFAELVQGPATVTPIRDIPFNMPKAPDAGRSRTEVHVIPSPYFDTVVDERAANVAEPISQKNAVQAGASAQLNFTKAQRRKLAR